MSKAVASFVVGACALVSLSSVASAQISLYTTQSSFNAATSSQGVDTYDDLPVSSISTPASRTAGSYTYTANSSSGLWGAGGGGDFWLSNNTNDTSIVLNSFSGGATAAGGFFFTSNLAGQYALGDITITAFDGTNTLSYTVVGSTTSSFVGFTSTVPLVSITIQTVLANASLWATANDFTLAIPTPGAAAMLGLGGLCAMRRRR